MNCTEFEREAEEILDERGNALPPDLQAHLALCASCRAEWEAKTTLLLAVRSWRTISAPRHLAAAVMEKLSKEGLLPQNAQVVAARLPRRREPRGSTFAAICAAAALVLLVAAISNLGLPPSPNNFETSRMATAFPAESADERQEERVAEAWAGLWRGMHDEYQGLSVETARVLSDLGKVSEAAVLLPPPPTVEPRDDHSAGSPWWGLHRPVSERVGRAFDFLKEALPTGASQSS